MAKAKVSDETIETLLAHGEEHSWDEDFLAAWREALDASEGEGRVFLRGAAVATLEVAGVAVATPEDREDLRRVVEDGVTPFERLAEMLAETLRASREASS